MLDTQLFVDGRWTTGAERRTRPNLAPATGQSIGNFALANASDVDDAARAALKVFPSWRAQSAYARSSIMRRAATELRARAEHIAAQLSLEQGKPISEAKIEVGVAADIIDWYAEEGRRQYGRIIPARASNVRQYVFMEPVGPVAAFTPWNFPIGQAVRKIAAALAAGCSIVVKGPEETPASCAELIKCFEAADTPPGVVQLLYGDPAAISSQLIAHDAIRKVSFTGSTSVGKQLAALAGQHMKRMTMELGGHAPVIVCEDADIDGAIKAIAPAKFRNAGQICASPSRFLVHVSVAKRFIEMLASFADALKLGAGQADMGPLAHANRVTTMNQIVADAEAKGAMRVTTPRQFEAGYFFSPTVLIGATPAMRIMNDEPFGPVAAVATFSTLDEAIGEANRLPYGLAAFAFTNNEQAARRLSEELETGMLSINHVGLALPETPFGGVKASGYGSEGGPEGLAAYVTPKFVTHATIPAP